MTRRLLTLAGALAAATLLFVAFVLPAEFGRDPLGSGALFGLTGLSGGVDGRSGPLAASGGDAGQVLDARTFPLTPFESVELKYDLAEGDGMVFCWWSTGEVLFDLHAEPEGGGIEDARGFAAGRGTGHRGTYVAPFDGIHGWFWENRGAVTVTVHLAASGFMTGATRYHDNDASRVPFPANGRPDALACGGAPGTAGPPGP